MRVLHGAQRCPSDCRRWAITSWPPACPRPTAATRAAAQAGASAAQAAAAGVQAYESTLDGVRKIVRQEGVLALWRGTSASLLMVRAAVSRNLRCTALAQTNAVMASSLACVKDTGLGPRWMRSFLLHSQVSLLCNACCIKVSFKVKMHPDTPLPTLHAGLVVINGTILMLCVICAGGADGWHLLPTV